MGDSQAGQVKDRNGDGLVPVGNRRKTDSGGDEAVPAPKSLPFLGGWVHFCL